MVCTRRKLLKSAVALASLGAATARLPLAVHAGNLPPARLPLEEFVDTPELVAALRKGVKAMKQRKPSDPLSWFYQAAIHGVTDATIQQALRDDPNVGNVNTAKYWNQCPHRGQNSANFLPWHRAHIFYFERILRMHAERDDFSLPYWDYTSPANDRKFPRVYGVRYLDGDLNNNDPENINPLWDEARDFYFTTYQHPLTDKIPLLALADTAVDTTAAMASPVFFGETEQTGLGGGIADDDPGTRGLLECSPHDQIHRAVGGVMGTCLGDMAIPPTAAFDPVFSVHHTNIDWLWVQWSCAANKSWGKTPPLAWFEERPWFFFDEHGTEINEPRRRYFDHRSLGIRYKYEDLTRTPLELPALMAALPRDALAAPQVLLSEPVATSDLLVNAPPSGRTIIALGNALAGAGVAKLSARLMQQTQSLSAQRLTLRLKDIEGSGTMRVGFDVHLTAHPHADLTRSSPGFLGSINLFNHSHHPGMALSQDLDASRALATGGNDPAALSLVFVPYPLLKVIATGAPYLYSQPLTVRGLEFRSA